MTIPCRVHGRALLDYPIRRRCPNIASPTTGTTSTTVIAGNSQKGSPGSMTSLPKPGSKGTPAGYREENEECGDPFRSARADTRLARIATYYKGKGLIS